MSLILDGTNGLTFNNATTQASAGVVLQVVNATYSTQVSTTSATFIATGLTATITPKFATSKILVLVNQNGCGKNATGVPSLGLRLFRNGSNIVVFASDSLYSGTSVELREMSYSISYQDSPATTSATTYSTVFNNNQASGTVYVNYGSDVSTITLMEIAG